MIFAQCARFIKAFSYNKVIDADVKKLKKKNYSTICHKIQNTKINSKIDEFIETNLHCCNCSTFCMVFIFAKNVTNFATALMLRLMIDSNRIVTFVYTKLNILQSIFKRFSNHKKKLTKRFFTPR